MKWLFRKWFINAVAIAVLATFMSGISYGGRYEGLLLASGVLTLTNMVLRPIIKILMLPINLITFGVLGWVIQVLIIYLVTIMVPSFTINAFDLGPVSVFGILLPKFVLSQFWALVVVAFSITLIRKIIRWIV